MTAATVQVKTDATVNDNDRIRMYTPQEADLFFPYLPDTISVSGQADVWTEHERAGRTPLLVRSGKNLSKWQMTVPLVADPHSGSGWHVETWLTVLRKHAESPYQTVMYFSSRWIGHVEVTEIGWEETDWDSTGRPIRVDVTLSLSEESKIAKPVGPVISGHLNALKKKKTKDT